MYIYISKKTTQKLTKAFERFLRILLQLSTVVSCLQLYIYIYSPLKDYSK